MTLAQRLEGLIGKNPGGCTSHSVVPGMLCIHGDCIDARAVNHSKAKERKLIPALSHSVLEDMLASLPVEQQCIVHHNYDDDCTTCAMVQGENLVITKTKAALTAYCIGKGRSEG